VKKVDQDVRLSKVFCRRTVRSVSIVCVPKLILLMFIYMVSNSNPWSWTSLANVVWVEQPVGVSESAIVIAQYC
jgi:hypothetical protein